MGFIVLFSIILNIFECYDKKLKQMVSEIFLLEPGFYKQVICFRDIKKFTGIPKANKEYSTKAYKT